jgi:HrpA-like RNA helicase
MMAALPTDPCVSKMVVTCFAFGMLEEAIVMAAFISGACLKVRLFSDL